MDQRSSIRTSSWKSNHASQTRRTAATILGKCLFVLRYPKDSAFELTAVSERRCDHADALILGKSTFWRIQMQSMWRYLLVVLSNVDEDTNFRLWLNTTKLTEYQLADMFTKALPEDRFKYLVRRIGMRLFDSSWNWRNKESVRFSALTLSVRREVL
ncbi:hypothetical protein Tco_0981233 [Tanacetum coccineum]